MQNTSHISHQTGQYTVYMSHIYFVMQKNSIKINFNNEQTAGSTRNTLLFIYPRINKNV